MGGGEGVWREVAGEVVEDEVLEDVLKRKEELTGWENVMLAALSLPGASGRMEMWNQGDYYRTSLVHVAAGVGSERVVNWVVERGGELEAKDEEGETPLFIACGAGSVGVVRMLVEGGGELGKDSAGQGVLFPACQSGDVGVVRYLLGLGVLNVEEEDRWGQSVLHVACWCGHLDVVKVLVEEWGVDVDKVDGLGRTPLSEAYRSRKEDVARYLVEVGGAGLGIASGGTTSKGRVNGGE